MHIISYNYEWEDTYMRRSMAGPMSFSVVDKKPNTGNNNKNTHPC